MHLDVLCVTREIRVIRTNAMEPESLTVSNTILTVAGMATGRVNVLVSVCRLGVKISDQSVMLLTDGHIQQEVGNFWGEFDGSVEGVDVVNKSMKTFFITGPNVGNIIGEAPPYPRQQGAASSICCSSLDMKRHAKEGAILVPMLVPKICR